MSHAKTLRRKEDRDGIVLVLLQDCGASNRGAVLLRGAVLPGRKHERSEASSARGMRGRLRGLRAGRPTPVRLRWRLISRVKVLVWVMLPPSIRKW